MPIAKNITLNHKAHIYTDHTGKVYTSVSKVLSPYKEPFDRDGIAKQVSKKTGQPVQEILAEWDSAAPYGTAVHEQLELFFRGQDGPIDLIAPHLETLIQWRDTDAQFYPETILCHPTLPIAGTADLIVKRGDGRYSIIDWKTNKSIYRSSFGGKMMKGSLNHLQDCNFMHYSLQLSLYALMLGEKINRLSIVHLPRDTDRLEIMPCPFLWREADLVFEEFGKQ